MPSGIRGFIVLTNAEYLERGEYMRKYKLLDLLDIHWLLIITVAIIAVLRFGIFGVPGLVVYGLLLVYNLIGIIFNLKHNKISFNFTFVFGCLYCLYFLLATLFNGTFADAASTLAQYLLIFVIASFIRKDDLIENDFISLAKVMTVAGLAMTLLSVVFSCITTAFPSLFANLPEGNYFDDIRLRICNLKVDRLAGFGGNPIVTAFYCYASIVFSVYLLSVSRNIKWKVLAVANFILSSVLIGFLARSRTYMGALAIFLIVYFIIYYCLLNWNEPQKRHNFKFLLLLSCLGLVIFFLLFIAVESFRDFILEQVLRIQNINTIGNREDIFSNTINAGKGYRLFGLNAKWFEQHVAPHTHNMYLEVLTFGGVPCFIFFILFWIAAIYTTLYNLYHRNLMSKTCQTINCLTLAYIVSFLVGGISEPGAVRSIRIAFPVLLIMIGSVCVIRYNLKKATT